MTSDKLRSKQEWRRVLGRRVGSLSRLEKAKASCQILKKLYGLPAFRTSTHILFYAATPDEVDTFPAIRHSLSRGKRVFLPRLKAKERKMGWGEVKNIRRDLVKGPYGILQPRARMGSIPLRMLELVICPALGFDARGGRLGRGAGYYDRFLKTLGPKTRVVGLAFSCQKVSSLPSRSHDVRIPVVITD